MLEHLYRNHIIKLLIFVEVKTHVVQLEGVDWFIRENGAKHHTNGRQYIFFCFHHYRAFESIH